LERVLRGRGRSPRVSSSSHNSSYDVQARVSKQSRQRHLLHLPGPVLRLVEDTHSHSRFRDIGELQLKRLLSVSSRFTSLRFPEVHGQGMLVFTSTTCGLARVEDSAVEECA
jgi:hypothetical protein